MEHDNDQVEHSSRVTATYAKDSWTHIIDVDVYNISCYCAPNSDTPNYNITRNWNKDTEEQEWNVVKSQ